MGRKASGINQEGKRMPPIVNFSIMLEDFISFERSVGYKRHIRQGQWIPIIKFSL